MTERQRPDAGNPGRRVIDASAIPAPRALTRAPVVGNPDTGSVSNIFLTPSPGILEAGSLVIVDQDAQLTAAPRSVAPAPELVELKATETGANIIELFPATVSQESVPKPENGDADSLIAIMVALPDGDITLDHVFRNDPPSTHKDNDQLTDPQPSHPGRVRRIMMIGSAATVLGLGTAACAADYNDTPVSQTQAAQAEQAILPRAQTILQQVLDEMRKGEISVSYPEPLDPKHVVFRGQTPAYADASTQSDTGKPEGYIDVEGEENVQGHPEDGMQIVSINIQADDDSGPNHKLTETSVYITDPDQTLQAFGPNKWEAFFFKYPLPLDTDKSHAQGVSTGPTDWYAYNDPGWVQHGPWGLNNAPQVLQVAQGKFDEIRSRFIQVNIRKAQPRG